MKMVRPWQAALIIAAMTALPVTVDAKPMKKYGISKGKKLRVKNRAKPKVAMAKSKHSFASQRRSTRSKHKTSHSSRYGAFFSIGAPHIYDLGLAIRTSRRSLHTVSGGYAEKRIDTNKAEDLKVSLFHFDYRFRYRLLQGHPIFLGSSLGYHQFDASGKKDLEVKKDSVEVAIPLQAQVTIRSVYSTPQITLQWLRTRSYSLGSSWGYLIPLWGDSEISSQFSEDPYLDSTVKNLSAYKKLHSDAERLGERLARLGLPFINLIEFAKFF